MFLTILTPARLSMMFDPALAAAPVAKTKTRTRTTDLKPMPKMVLSFFFPAPSALPSLLSVSAGVGAVKKSMTLPMVKGTARDTADDISRRLRARKRAFFSGAANEKRRLKSG